MLSPVKRLSETLHPALMLSAILLLLVYLVIYIVFALNLIQFPFDYDQGEGFELVDTILFSQGEFPYKDTNIYPFYSSNYPPLFHVIAAPFVWLFGPAYWYGRLLGALARSSRRAPLATPSTVTADDNGVSHSYQAWPSSPRTRSTTLRRSFASI